MSEKPLKLKIHPKDEVDDGAILLLDIFLDHHRTQAEIADFNVKILVNAENRVIRLQLYGVPPKKPLEAAPPNDATH